jgi:hypothetical protein
MMKCVNGAPLFLPPTHNQEPYYDQSISKFRPVSCHARAVHDLSTVARGAHHPATPSSCARPVTIASQLGPSAAAGRRIRSTANMSGSVVPILLHVPQVAQRR